MWLSCSIKNVALKAGSLCHKWVQRLAQRPRFVWELSLTTRPSHHLTLMDPTYAVITRPTGCQLWRGYALVFQRDATQTGGSVFINIMWPSQRSRKKQREGNVHWHLIVIYYLDPGNKGLFFWGEIQLTSWQGIQLTSWQGIKQAKKDMQAQRALCSAELSQRSW